MKKRKCASKMRASRSVSTTQKSFPRVDKKALHPTPVISRNHSPQIKAPNSHYKKSAYAVCSVLVTIFLGTYLTLTHDTSADEIVVTQKITPDALAALEKPTVPHEELLSQENVLYIPKLDVITTISEGEYEDEKKYTKAWRRTHTSTPDAGGNTVIVGHRYKDNSPNYPLYAIEEIIENDEIIVYWDGQKYTYTVYNTQEVHETAIEIEDGTDDDQLTLYACDWSGKNRLVVHARLLEK